MRAESGTEPATGTRMATHDIVVIGAPAGGVEAISMLLSQLSRDLKAAITETESPEDVAPREVREK